MTPEEITKIVDMLAEKLGPLAQTVWMAYVRQVYFEGLVDVVVWLVFLALALTGVLLIIKAYKVIRGLNNYDSIPDMTLLHLTVGMFLTATFTIVVMMTASEVFTKVINPSYWAVQRLLGR